MAHPDVPSEQDYVDLAYTRLSAMRDATRSMVQEAFSDKSSGFQAVTERDVRVRSGLNRLEQLFIGSESLVFGRIDRRAEEPYRPESQVHDGRRNSTDSRSGDSRSGDARSGDSRSGDARSGDARSGDPREEKGNVEQTLESFHIGRLGVSGVDQEPLVVDWRAPVAEPFYRATGAHPMGLVRRRHLLCNGSRVIDLEDELFDTEGDSSGRSLGLEARQVLLASLERSRSGRMRDIVATVQGEQDEIIRAALPGVIVVQGGPGTGKTAVALHRAAYLLYTHRFPLEKQGVLVVGPNRTFLRYIEHVLPSLDETGVEMSTVNGLYPSTAIAIPASMESNASSKLKGDARMAKVILRGVGARQRPLRHPVGIAYGGRILRLSVTASEQIVAAARRRPGTHNARRRIVEAYLWRYLVAQLAEAEDPPAGAASTDPNELGRTLKRIPEVAEALERMWPLLSPEQFLRDLYGAKALVDLAAGGVLSEEEKLLLLRDRGESLEATRWTASDVALLDEAWALLGPRHKSGADPVGAQRTYGHVVVDEAQDLSPMQLRMIARRSLSASMTLVGDIAQATGPAVPASWGEVVSHLAPRRGWKLLELSVNYRTPSEIMELAAQVLAKVDPSLRPPESVRSSGRQPRVLRCDPDGGTAGLLDSVLAVLHEEIAVLSARRVAAGVAAAGGSDGRLDSGDAAERFGGVEGTLAVISAPSMLDGVAMALEGANFEFGVAGREALDRSISVLSVDDAKGLEFDSVVVVEPARVAAESPQGLRGLYVAFTRATQSLAVIHLEDLPVDLYC